MEGKYLAKNENEVLTFEGHALADDADKANAFAKTYKFTTLPARKSDLSFRRKVRRRLKRKEEPIQESEQDITMEESFRRQNRTRQPDKTTSCMN